MDRITTLFQVVRERGVLRTLAFLVSHLVDLRFESRYGTDTVSWVRIKDLEIDSEYLEGAVDYQPTQRLALMKLLRRFDFPKDAGDGIFVADGRRRLRLTRENHGFTRCIGRLFEGIVGFFRAQADGQNQQRRYDQRYRAAT